MNHEIPKKSDAIDKIREEQARNLIWQYGEIFLSTSQQIELFGDGVELLKDVNRANRPDSLPIADMSFINKKAKIMFVEEDYEYILDVICRPDNLNSYKASAFYIGSGIAPAILHEFLCRNRNYQMIDEVYEYLYMTLPKDNLKERIMINQGTSRDLPILIDNLFENLMISDEKRLIRINLMRYGIGTLFRIMESANVNWSLWQKDDRDRAGYVISLRDSCANELADMLRAQHRLDIISKSLGKSENWQSNKFYDRVPEILIAGSMPMSAGEIDELNEILMANED